MCAPGAVARFRAAALQARANKACSVCQGSKLDRDGAVRSRLGVIRAAVPTVFRYCCAHGTSLGRNELPHPGHSTLFFLLLGMVQIVHQESEDRTQDGKCSWLQDYPRFQVAGRAASPTKTTGQNYAASEKHPLPTSATNIRYQHPPQTSATNIRHKHP